MSRHTKGPWYLDDGRRFRGSVHVNGEDGVRAAHLVTALAQARAAVVKAEGA